MRFNFYVLFSMMAQPCSCSTRMNLSALIKDCLLLLLLLFTRGTCDGTLWVS